MTLTCQVEEATGAETYQWTSSLAAVTNQRNMRSRTVVRSSDSGSHTCTATRTTPPGTGTATFEMNVIGECAHLYPYQQFRHVHVNRSDWSCQILSTGSHQFEPPTLPGSFLLQCERSWERGQIYSIFRVDICICRVDTCICRVDTCICRVDSCISRVDTCISRVDTCISRVDTSQVQRFKMRHKIFVPTTYSRVKGIGS